MRVSDRALVAEHPSLGEGSDSMHAWEHDVCGLAAPLDVDRLVKVAVPDGWRVARPGVGDEGGSLLDVLGDESVERRR